MRDFSYDDEHRMFLQALMVKGILKSKDVHRLMDDVFERFQLDMPDNKEARQAALLQMIMQINSKLETVHLCIRKAVDEDDGGNYFMLTSVASRPGELGQAQSQFTAGEMEYVRLLALEILQDDNRSVPSSLALNLAGEVCASIGGGGGSKFTMSQAEGSLKKLVNHSWLKMLDKGYITLGVRFIGEMDEWLRETMGENLTRCKICSKMLIRGIHCVCGLMYHRHCAAKMAKATKSDFRCVGCQCEVNDGEQSKNAGRGRPRKTGINADGENEQSDDEDAIRTKKRKEKKRSFLDSDDSGDEKVAK